MKTYQLLLKQPMLEHKSENYIEELKESSEEPNLGVPASQPPNFATPYCINGEQHT